MKTLILAFLGCILMGAAGAQTVSLPAPDILGVSCGGYLGQSSVTIVGFDTNGNIQGILNEAMSCSAGGKGGHSHTYTGSSNVTWDFRGGFVTSWNAPLAIPSVSNVATDSYGNVVTVGVEKYTLASVLTINQMPPNPDYLQALVPDVVGLTVAAADAEVTAAGLVPAEYDDANGSGTPGIVFSQSLNQGPAAGSVVPYGTVIDFWAVPAAVTGGGNGNHCKRHCND